jgi:hypothetical protein
MTPAIVPAGSARSVGLLQGQILRVVDPNGGQSGDVTAFRAGDPTEWLSNGRSFDYGGKIYFSTGDVLYSNRSNPMLTILRDDVGRHDFLYAACSVEMYRIQYGATDGHPNCLDNLAHALADLGIAPHRTACRRRSTCSCTCLSSPTVAWSSARRRRARATRSGCAPRWISRSGYRRARHSAATGGRHCRSPTRSMMGTVSHLSRT